MGVRVAPQKGQHFYERAAFSNPLLFPWHVYNFAYLATPSSVGGGGNYGDVFENPCESLRPSASTLSNHQQEKRWHPRRRTGFLAYFSLHQTCGWQVEKSRLLPRFLLDLIHLLARALTFHTLQPSRVLKSILVTEYFISDPQGPHLTLILYACQNKF